MVDSQRRDGRETGEMMYARGKNQPWANLLPTTKPISLLSGFAKDGGPNFYQQYNESGDMMGWTKRLWEETTYSLVSLQVRMATPLLLWPLCSKYDSAGKCKGKDRCFRAYCSRSRAFRSKLPSRGKGQCLSFAHFYWRKLLRHSPRSLWQSSCVWQSFNSGHQVVLLGRAFAVLLALSDSPQALAVFGADLSPKAEKSRNTD